MKTIALLLVSAVTACAQAAGPEELTGHTGTVVALSWSPDGKELASIGDKTLRVWPSAGGASREKKLVSTPTCLDWSPDGKSIATGGNDKTVRVWAAADFAAAGSEKEHAEAILDVDFSGDSREVVSVDEAGKFVVWELTKKHPRLEYEAGKADARLGAISAPGYGVAQHLGVGLTIFDLATGNKDKQLQIWEVSDTSVASRKDAKPVDLAGNSGTPSCAAFSPDGSRLAVGSADKNIRIWDLRK